MQPPEASALANVTRELEELHEQVVRWIDGDCPKTDEKFHRGIADRLDEAFHLIAPSGHVVPRAMMLHTMHGLHGSNPDFRITISDVQLIAQEGEIIVARCRQKQRGAKQSQKENERHITAVFARDASQPHGIRWLYAHESWTAK